MEGSPTRFIAGNVPRGGERSPSKLHRDEDRSDGERQGMEDDAGAPIERRGGAGDPPLRGGDDQDAIPREPGLLFRFRDLSGRRSTRGGADRLPQSVTTPGEKNPRARKKIRRTWKKSRKAGKKILSREIFFLKRGIIIAPW